MRYYLTILFLILACGMAAQNVSLLPSPQLAQLQQIFVEYVHLDTATQIRGCMVKVNYDPAKVTFVSAARGSIWTGFSNFWWQCVHETSTRVRIECIIMGAGLSVTGPGNMFNVTFTAIGGDYTSIFFSALELYDIEGYVIPGSSYSNGDVIIGASPAYAKVKCWLQGPYSADGMLTGLNSLLPLTAPYSADPVTTNSIPADVVDWALMELRSSATGQPVASRSLLLDSSGYLHSPGVPFILMMNVSPGPYYVVLRHRNHLALMSAQAFQFTSSGVPPELDLTLAANIYGNSGTVEVAPGEIALISGDADQNGVIGPTDRNNHWRLQVGQSGYFSADLDLDGSVFPNDLNDYWRVNSGRASAVPAAR
jgi:hypothetical protein